MRLIPVILLFTVSCIGGGVNRKNQEGAELYREGKLDEALAAFTQAQVQSPDAPELHYNIGNVHYRKEEMDKATEEYRAALRGEPSVQQPAHYNTGNVRYRGQDFPGAVEAYKQALKIDPDDIEARQNLELALKQEEQQQEGGSRGEADEGDEQQSDPSSKTEQEDEQQREQEQQQKSQQDQREMSQEEAERLLAALAEMEKTEQRRQQQKQQIKVRGKKKDW